MIIFDSKNTIGYVKDHEIEYFEPFVETAHELLHQKKGPGSDYLVVDLPMSYDVDEFARIKSAAKE